MFLASCKANTSVDWLIHGDFPPPISCPPNVRFVQISRQDYLNLVSSRLGIRFNPNSMYSVCNVRPAFGIIHKESIDTYDFFGWGDLDVIYGDLRAFYELAIEESNVISNDARICSGHLTLIRNEGWLREAFALIPDWRQRLESAGPTAWADSLDEARLSSIFSPDPQARKELAGLGTREIPAMYWSNNYFVDQWVTPFVPKPWLDGSPIHPEIWLWGGGRIWNERDMPRTFPYLHLMNFKAHRYVDLSLYGKARTWSDSKRLIDFNCEELDGQCVEISRSGFRLLRTSQR